jgi:thiol-disulfide isomerase/thioredoxin
MSNVYRQFQEHPLAARLTLVVVLVGSLLTLVQIILLESGLDGLCYSGGCEIVDSQTTIPPLFFNFFGLVFFQAVFWGVWAGRRSEELQFYVRTLLLAGLAAEGVLVSFQYVVVESFCTYCLIIFSLVALLNLLRGLRQAVTGAAIFAAVVIAFSTLQFTATTSESTATGINDLGKGAYAVLTGEAIKPKLVLFFSSTCPHCEKVIESMQQGTTCTVSFNPVSKVTKFPLTGVMANEHYDIGVNRAFMTALGRTHIPVLLIDQQKSLELIGGGNAIMNYLDESCRPTSATPASRSNP